MKTTPFFALFFSLITFAFGQENDCSQARSQVYQGFLANSPNLIADGVDAYAALFKADPSLENRFHLVQARDVLMGYCMQDENCGVDRDELLDEMIEDAKRLNQKDDKNAAYAATLSSLYGVKIGLNPMQGMFLGSKSTKLIDEALALDPTHPLVQLEKAGSLYFTPEMWGGDKQQAIKHYQKAVAAFEAQDDLANNWHYLEALAWLGQAYAATDQPDQARATYQKALAFEPKFRWVSEGLLPALDER
jgi:tetratricopeptide (TPR) repeat protein